LLPLLLVISLILLLPPLLLVRLLLPSQPPLPSPWLLSSSVAKSIPRLNLPRCRRLLHWSDTNRIISLELRNLFLLSKVHQIHLNINHSRIVLLLLLERRESVSSAINNLDRDDRDKAVKETKNNTLPTLSCQSSYGLPKINCHERLAI
jgi:hypothetical protein